MAYTIWSSLWERVKDRYRANIVISAGSPERTKLMIMQIALNRLAVAGGEGTDTAPFFTPFQSDIVGSLIRLRRKAPCT